MSLALEQPLPPRRTRSCWGRTARAAKARKVAAAKAKVSSRRRIVCWLLVRSTSIHTSHIRKLSQLLTSCVISSGAAGTRGREPGQGEGGEVLETL